MQKILIASGKGGVGKSTLSVCLGRALLREQKSVLLVDCDIGLKSLDILTGMGKNAVYSWADFLNEACTKDDVLLQDEKSGLALLTAPNMLTEYPDKAAFQKMLESWDTQFDFCILDAGAGVGPFLHTLAACADLGIFVATPDPVSARGAGVAAESVEDVLPPERARLLLNRYAKKDAQNGQSVMADTMVDLTQLRLLGAVPEDSHLKGLARGENPERYAEESFRRIAKRILGQNIPFREKKLKSVVF